MMFMAITIHPIALMLHIVRTCTAPGVLDMDPIWALGLVVGTVSWDMADYISVSHLVRITPIIILTIGADITHTIMPRQWLL